MLVRMECEESGLMAGKRSGKRGRPNGPVAPGVAEVLDRLRREMEPLARELTALIAREPRRFGEIELKLHREMTRRCGQLMASMLSEATRATEFQQNVETVVAEATAPMGGSEKKS